MPSLNIFIILILYQIGFSQDVQVDPQTIEDLRKKIFDFLNNQSFEDIAAMPFMSGNNTHSNWKRPDILDAFLFKMVIFLFKR